MRHHSDEVFILKCVIFRNGEMSGSGKVTVKGSRKMLIGIFKRNNLQMGNIAIS